MNDMACLWDVMKRKKREYIKRVGRVRSKIDGGTTKVHEWINGDRCDARSCTSSIPSLDTPDAPGHHSKRLQLIIFHLLICAADQNNIQKKNQPNDKLSTVCLLFFLIIIFVCFWIKHYRVLVSHTRATECRDRRNCESSFVRLISLLLLLVRWRDNLCRDAASATIEDGGDKHDRNNGPASRFILVLFLVVWRNLLQKDLITDWNRILFFCPTIWPDDYRDAGSWLMPDSSIDRSPHRENKQKNRRK